MSSQDMFFTAGQRDDEKFNKFVYDLILHFYDDVEEERARTFENALAYIDNNIREEQVNRWRELNDLPKLVADLLNWFQVDIQAILSDMLIEQEELDKEATEDYHERMEEYRRVQGWK